MNCVAMDKCSEALRVSRLLVFTWKLSRHEKPRCTNSSLQSQKSIDRLAEKIWEVKRRFSGILFIVHDLASNIG